MTIGDDIAVPVIVGLASGIALVAIFGMLLHPPSDTSGSFAEPFITETRSCPLFVAYTRSVLGLTVSMAGEG
ncbi:MAG: hypothetical protein ACREBU_04845 [Nitrososphaera sp.]